MDNVYLDTTIKELSSIEKLSTRATNICQYNNFKYLFHILDYYVSNGSFLDIRNCGLRTSQELLLISLKYIDLYPFQNEVNNEPPDFVLLPYQEVLFGNKRLSNLQKKILTNFINVKIRTLSYRFNNALIKFLKDDLSFDTFDRLILSIPERNMSYIKGMGKKSYIELKYFTNVINGYIDIIKLYDETELIREFYVTYIQRFYRIEDEVLRHITSGYHFSRGIPIFKTIFYLSKFRKILGETERLLFFSDNYRYIDFSADKLFVELSECTITRERIRQVNKYLPSKLHENVYKIFLEDLNNFSLNTYSLDREADFIHVESKLLEQIRTSEKISFTQQFVTFILSSLYDNSHFLLGDVEWFYPLQRRRRFFAWQNFYLINRRFEHIFNFREFVLFLSQSSADQKHANHDNDHDYHLFLSRFFFANDYSEMDTIANICESIIHIEFSTVIIMNDIIILKQSPHPH